MYIAQSLVHSFVAAIIVDRAIQIWGIKNPAARQRFRFMVIFLPIILFPVYQAVTPERGAISFRLDALLDINGWLSLKIWDTIPISSLFILLMAVTTLIFFLQEMLPILRHLAESNKTAADMEMPGEDSFVSRTIAELPVEKPGIFIIDDDDLVLFSSTSKKPSVYLSSGLVNAFTPDQLKAAVAHEIAHIIRSKRPLLIIVFFLRMLMFFNPVVLLEFRRIVQDEEKVCDDFALSLTGKPHALVETLKMLHQTGDPTNIKGVKSLSGMAAALEKYSHNSLLESRISRLEKGHPAKSSGGWLEVLATLGVITVINYFIV